MKVIDSLYPTTVALWANVSGSLTLLRSAVFSAGCDSVVGEKWASQSLRGVRFQN